jgi:hypothetical protein
MRILKLALMAALIAAPAITIAQTPKPAVQKPTIGQRQFNQQRRIANGVKSGRLNPRKAARLERQHRNINRQVHMMRARHNGRLTARNRRAIYHRQNVASRRIYRARHNRHNG